MTLRSRVAPARRTTRPLHRLGVAAAAFGLLAGALLAGTPSASAALTSTRPPHLSFVLRMSGLGTAVKVVASPDGSGRLFVVDKVGIVWVWTPGQAHASVYLDLRSRVNSLGNEQGLLSMAFWPGFRGAPLFFVSYTRSDGSLVISRFVPASPSQASVSAATEEEVMVIPHPTYTNHNGGDLAFGHDLDLYISTGDGGGEGDPVDLSQNITSWTGKMLRIDAYHSCAPYPRYCPGAGNPYIGRPGAKPEIWDVGLRNPWRFSFDPLSGSLFIADVGQDRYEEVDQVAGAAKAINFGWSCWEARAIYNASRCAPGVHYTAPVAVIAHPSAEALIGGVVYRGTRYYALMGPRYILGDYITGNLWTMNAVDGVLTPAGRLGSVTSFGTDDAKEVWATTLTGGLYQMVAS
jgi:glucose/arabinose dehydrogenase